MKNEFLSITGKKGSACEPTKYCVVDDPKTGTWLYLRECQNNFYEPLLMGRVESINKRGLLASGFALIGKPLKIHLDRQHFDFVEITR